MTQAEFKAWFEGFTEALEGAPNKAQWKRIKERVAEIDGKEITERVFIDRYWGPYYYNPHRYWLPVYGTFCGQNLSGAIYNTSNQALLGQNYSSANAMYSLGKVDAGDVKQNL